MKTRSLRPTTSKVDESEINNNESSLGCDFSDSKLDGVDSTMDSRKRRSPIHVDESEDDDVDFIPRRRPILITVRKGPKKLLLKSKNGTPRSPLQQAQKSPEHTFKLIRGKNSREFKLLRWDNFNFEHVEGRGRRRRTSADLIHSLVERQEMGAVNNDKLMLNPLLDSIRPMCVKTTVSPFERRATAIQWHPTQFNRVAVGSKGGEITVLDVNKKDPTDEAVFLPGIGPGGSVGAMRFVPETPDWLLTSCLDSKVSLRNLERNHLEKVLHDTGDWNKWFVSCDVGRRLYAGGMSNGVLHLFDRVSLSTVTELKIHKAKINHVAFSAHHEYLLATASVDHEVRIWDVRKMENVNDKKGKPAPLHSLSHDAGVNVASFSACDGRRLLTSDQYGQIRVYALPGFYLERSILHPHRQFQHLTPIKAAWHPLQDLIVIGRWPDPTFVDYTASERRCIDLIDANSGKTVLELFEPSLGGIISLNEFSNDGRVLCSGMSRSVVIWRQPDDYDGDAAALDALSAANLVDGTWGGAGSSSGAVSKRASKKKADGKEKKTLKAKTEMKPGKSKSKSNKKTEEDDEDEIGKIKRKLNKPRSKK